MRPRPHLSRAPALLAAVLWFASTFFFLGDTGKHSDDYSVALRNQTTGAFMLANHPWVRWPYFWRPLHLAHASAINTISWEHPWIGHLELAVVHALVAWMLMGFLVRLGIRRPIAYAAALLFLTCPLLAEAVLWTSASCNAISCLFLLWTLELVRREAASSPGPGSRTRTLVIAILAFLTACWYEPAAAALAAVPLVYLAAAPRDRAAAPASGPESSWPGTLRCTIAAGLGCLLYAALLFITVPAKGRGGSESFVTLASAIPRTRSILSDTVRTLIGSRARDIFIGSIQQGWQSLHSPVGLALALLTAIALPLACIAIVRPSQPTTDPTLSTPVTPTRSPRGLIALAGAAIFICAWLPIVVVTDQSVQLRSLYVPLLGLAILGSALANGAADALANSPSRRLTTSLAAATALAIACAGAIGMIGFQTQFRVNASHDCSAVEQLRRIVPDPPPNTLFLPLRIDTHGAATGRRFYDDAIHDAFDAPWSCRAIVRTAYRRTDIAATATPKWLKSPDSHGIRRLHDQTLVAWDRCIPFTLDHGGTVHLIPRLTVIPTDAAPFAVNFPRVPPGPDSTGPATWRLRDINGTHCEVEQLISAPSSPPSH